MTPTQGRRRVALYTVHTAKPDDIGAIEVVFDNQRSAEAFAADRSRDPGVLSASVTRYFLGELGSRHPMSWFVDGVEQPPRFDRRLYPTDRHDHPPTRPETGQPRNGRDGPEA